MQDLPLISVVIPVYNHEKFIAQSLESVISQTYSNLQILVSDDKSSDNSLNIIEQYAAKDKRIEILRHDTNLGICGNFNSLFDAVKGEFVAFFSGDDVMSANKLMLQYELLSKTTGAVVVHHNAQIIDGNGVVKYMHRGNMLPLCNPLDWALKADFFHLRKIAPLLPTTCLAKTDYYLHARYNKNFKYKHELLFTIEDYCNNPQGKWLYINQPLLSYRLHENNFTNNPTFTTYLNEEKFKLADMALQKCPALKKRITSYRLFMLFETIVYKWYNNAEELKELKTQYGSEAGLGKKIILEMGVLLQNLRLYGMVSKMLHRLYRPFYLMKYYNHTH